MWNTEDTEALDRDFGNCHCECEEDGCDAIVHVVRSAPCNCGAPEGTRISYYYLCPTHAAKAGALLKRAGVAETLRLLDAAVGQ